MLRTHPDDVEALPSFVERRQFGRRQVAFEGQVHVPLRPPLACRMLNLSQGGALLEIDRYEWVPAKFRVVVGHFESECVVRHRDRRHIGVEFTVPCRFDPE